VLGVELLYGGTFPPSFDRERHNGIILGYGLWQRQFGGNPAVVGRTVTLDASPALNPGYTVFGVLPSGMDFPSHVDLYRSIFINPSFPDLLRRDRRSVFGIARLASSASIDSARAELRTVSDQLAHEFPATNQDLTLTLTPLNDVFSGPVRPYVWLLTAAVATVLLIAVVNVTNLLLSRGRSREIELAIRQAVGATRVDLVRQLVIEGLMLSVAGGVLGIALAYGFLAVLTQLVKVDLPVWMDPGMELSVILLAAVTSLLAGVVASAAPALRMTTDVAALRRAGGRAIGGVRHARLRRILLTSELAVSVVLLVMSGLMMQTFLALWQTDLGFRADGLLTFKLALPVYYNDDATRQFQRQLLERLQALPGVTQATCNANLPLARVGDDERDTVLVEGQAPLDAAANPYVNFQRVCDRYFDTMRIPILRGRALTAADRDGTSLVAVVSSRAASRLWPGRDPVGQRFRKLGSTDPWIQVVGVTGDVRHASVASPPGFDIYLSAEQMPDGWMHMVVRTDRAEPMSLVQEARAAVRAINPQQPVGEFQTMQERALDTAWQQRVAAFLLGLFSLLALALASVGIYGVTAYSVGQRLEEFGVRRALGAQPRDLLSVVLLETAGVALSGIAIGLGAALAGARIIRTLLYNTGVVDPTTFVAVPLILLTVAMAAAFLPARRAARLDPMRALPHV
jgi:putative ABC transport system permease protein